MGNPEAYERFWNEFLPELRANGWTPLDAPPYTRGYMRLGKAVKSPPPHLWHYSASFCSTNDRGPANRLRAEVCIEKKDKAGNKAVFNKLCQQKAQIEKAVGESLCWARKDDTRRSRISLYFGGSILITDLITDKERRHKAQVWLIDALGRMRAAFDPVLEELYP